MSTTELKLWTESTFQQAYAAFDDVLYHQQKPDRLVELVDVIHAATHELARREL